MVPSWLRKPIPHLFSQHGSSGPTWANVELPIAFWSLPKRMILNVSKFYLKFEVAETVGKAYRQDAI